MQPEGPILIVDDEEDIRDLLDLHLRREGFSTLMAANAQQALEVAKRDRPALVVLDLMLPDLSGTEVCRRLRADEATANIPVIMLTAKGEEIDRVVGFEVGADDYVVKASFSMREFVLRVRAVLRRRAAMAPQAPEPEPEGDRLVHGTLEIDVEGHQVYVDDKPVELTATEFRLLMCLATRPSRVQTRGTLLQEVWDQPPDLNTRTVDTHVKRLREKLGSAAAHIKTVRGVGYRFSTDPGS
ncbi:MAG: response regulator transcription factor [Myxococcales bacterium]|nr:response regulator transcription factor [Myxococcales bacterium]MCB9670510.1 response regulator transcription factor [Alphaproteobacteria bacterium]